jgi:ATP/maltotriose-dependent transcriptional regulator MalT
LLIVEAQLQTGLLTDAEELLARAERVYVDTYGWDHTKMSFLELIKGKFARAEGNVETARQLFSSCYGRRLEEYHENHSDVLIVALELAKTELVAGEAKRAQDWLDKTTEGIAEIPDYRIEYIEARIVEAEILSAQGRNLQAQKVKDDLIDVLSTRFPERSDWMGRINAI